MKQDMLILSTRETTEEDEKLARQLGFNLKSYPLLKFEYLNLGEEELYALWEMAPDAWVFTSKNGVEGFIRIFEQGFIPKKPKKIYAVGKKTASKLQMLGFDSEVPETENGAALANLIIEQGNIRSIVHFCGNLRREELSDNLRRNDIQVNERIVYKTIREKPKYDLPKNLRAILFYSPSAVGAFFEAFDKAIDIPLVAIGPTTASALNRLNSKKIIEADDASTESMLKALKQHL